MQAELPEEAIEQALAFYKVLGVAAQSGFKTALANCRCHVCLEILRRIECEQRQFVAP
jgi:late competence protein required for DNA uptake (superfamily II DNA/RNA helicase)